MSSSSYSNTFIPMNFANLFKLSPIASFPVNTGKFKITSVAYKTQNSQEALA